MCIVTEIGSILFRKRNVYSMNLNAIYIEIQYLYKVIRQTERIFELFFQYSLYKSALFDINPVRGKNNL